MRLIHRLVPTQAYLAAERRFIIALRRAPTRAERKALRRAANR